MRRHLAAMRPVMGCSYVQLATLVLYAGAALGQEQSSSSDSCPDTTPKASAALLQRRQAQHASMVSEEGDTEATVAARSHRRGGLSTTMEVHKQTGALIVVREDSPVALEGVGSWIITVKEGCTSDLVHHMAEHMPAGTTPEFEGDPDHGGLCTFVMRGTKAQVEEELASHQWPSKPLVEADTPCNAIPEVPSEGSSGERPALAETRTLPWGLDRIDSRETERDGSYNTPDGVTGKGVHVYVLDTGIRTTHQDFGGRAVPTLESLGPNRTVCDPSDTGCAMDRQGHGTHCAGTVGGTKLGVAPGAQLHAVKVLNDEGRGSTAPILAAIDWVLTSGPKPAVISMSLGGQGTSYQYVYALDTAVNGGVTVVVAAGNEGESPFPSACDHSPAFAKSAITVGATDRKDARASFSNVGPCVDIFAPGDKVESADAKSDSTTKELSGTSMACPHVAGAVALMLEESKTRTPADARQLLVSRSTKGIISDAGFRSPNRLLYLGHDTQTPAPTPAPTAVSGFGSCGFEGCWTENCEIWHQANDDQFQWQKADEWNPIACSGYYAPDEGHGYLCMDNDNWRAGDKGTLRSLPLQLDRPAVLSLQYYMTTYSDSALTITVNSVVALNITAEDLSFADGAWRGWSQASVDLSKYTGAGSDPVVISIVGTIGGQRTLDVVGVDDLEISELKPGSQSLLGLNERTANAQTNDEHSVKVNVKKHRDRHVTVYRHRQLAGARLLIHSDSEVAKTGRGRWLISIPEGCTSALVHRMAEHMPAGTVPEFEGDPDHGGLCMFFMQGTKEQVEEELSSHEWPSLPLVETAFPVQAIPEMPGDQDSSLLEQRSGIPWGLDRIDERDADLDGAFAPPGGNKGEGVHVYVLDTGIRTTHEDFEGRAVPTLESYNGKDTSVCAASNSSCAIDRQGHGTHCAGTVGGLKYGVAKAAILHAVKVLGDDGSGTTAGIIRGIDWILTSAQRPGVISMSLGGPGSSLQMHYSVDAAVNAGIPVVVAAGNSGRTPTPWACDYSPAFVRSAITVGSTTNTDARSGFSNIGGCVDIFAPGSDILSATSDSDTAFDKYSGTSMACPHVAGAVALILAANNSLSSLEVLDLLLARSTKGVVTDPKPASPNKLLYVGLDTQTAVTVPQEAMGICSFEKCAVENCGIWYASNEGDFRWSQLDDRVTGPQAMMNIFKCIGGPDDSTWHGHAYMCASSWDHPANSTAVLKSQPLNLTTFAALSFSFFSGRFQKMELSVWVEVAGVSQRLWRFSTEEREYDHGTEDEWQEGGVDLRAYKGDTPVVSIVARSLPSSRGSVAIDKLEIRPAPAPTPAPIPVTEGTCTFEHGWSLDCADWLNATGDDLEWELGPPRQSFFPEGPGSAAEGKHYLIVSAPYGGNGGEVGVLKSKPLRVSGPRDLVFNYFVWQDYDFMDMGRLALKVGDKVLWEVSDSQKAWRQARVNLAAYAGSNTIELSFVMTNGWSTEVALDALTFEVSLPTPAPTPAPTPVPPPTAGPTPAPTPAPVAAAETTGLCTFEFGLESDCANWFNTQDDDLDWKAGSGRHKFSMGPESAKEGQHYLAVTVPFGAQKGDQAILKSRPLTVSGPCNIVLSYFIWSRYDLGPLGKLEVKVGDKVLWQVSGAQGKEWHTATVSLADYPTGSTIEIAVVMTRDSGFYTDMAIDALGFEAIA